MTKTSRPGLLAHLDPDTIETLIRRYYAGEPIATLLAEYAIACRTSDLFRHFPPRLLHDPRCELCGGTLFEVLQSRSAPKHLGRDAICITCSHQPFQGQRCQCSTCTDRRRQEQEQKARSIREAIRSFVNAPDQEPPEHDPEALSLWEVVALLTLVRTGSWQSETTIGPLSASRLRATPDDRLTRELIGLLMQADLVHIDPASPPTAFRLTEGRVTDYALAGVRWCIRARDPSSLIRALEERVREGTWPPQWTSELAEVCHTLAHAEAREFIRYCLSQRGLREPGETALRNLLANLFQDYSVSQVFRIVWHGARSAADFLVRKEVHASHASNFFVGACQRWADRARAEGWEVKGFSRNFELGRSQMSHVVYDVILKVGDVGFTDCLTGLLQASSQPIE